MKTVLFVCIGNSCRSQMAEAFFNRYAPQGYRAESAGTAPADVVSSNAIAVMQELGIDIVSRIIYIRAQLDNQPAFMDIQGNGKRRGFRALAKHSCNLERRNAVEFVLPGKRGRVTYLLQRRVNELLFQTPNVFMREKVEEVNAIGAIEPPPGGSGTDVFVPCRAPGRSLAVQPEQRPGIVRGTDAHSITVAQRLPSVQPERERHRAHTDDQNINQPFGQPCFHVLSKKK